ncbi:zf-HC2 domain-containing protein [Mucilaginibacter paludis]|uniref:Zinc-finger domain-containing protein n=1 Tax=Mucilaginibacter paludis DSM 18603 TaxID=714943 RepID=H1YFQ2_9SPHI|nr:zf-HC2 domain-containing protein [Mucilaginibacter paludis]EHQ24454.1 hypothetical protein Mucpa_0255 [Mucilaginibacter paludis DSM 18603]
MKNTLKNIAYNCRKATWLIEKKQIGGITIREKLELKVHLAGCSECRMFEQQSIVINKLVRDLFHELQITKGIKLDGDFKKKMHDQIMTISNYGKT